MTASAPAVNRLRKERSPCLLILPSLSLPPLECCFGTSPIQAEKFRPDRKALRISDAGDQSGGERGTNAGNLIEPLARLIGSVPGDNLTVKVENLHL